MKNNFKKTFLYLFLISSFILLLTESSTCIALAVQGLLIWFEKMIPTLFPFMVLSGFIVKSGLSMKLGALFHPVFGFLLRISSPMLYAVFMGFFCGFPMGAKVICDLLEEKQITKKQGEYLLAFSNNIGPVYMLGYVLPLFGWSGSFKYLLIFYAVPFLYGLFLRYFSPYRGWLRFHDNAKSKLPMEKNKFSFGTTGYMDAMYQALHGSLEQITLLGGCMILFNCLQIFPLKTGQLLPHTYFDENRISFLTGILCSLTEIGGGLAGLEKLSLKTVLSTGLPLSATVFALLTFGGLSCIFQTRFIIAKTGLSIQKYIGHKVIQSLLIFLICFMTD